MPTAVVTFGSMVRGVARGLPLTTPRTAPPPPPPQALARDTLLADVVAVLLSHGYKVVLLTGWKEQHPRGVPTRAQDPRVFSLPEASHAWLFASASLVVHHGGAGTTGRALASGVPSLVIPVLRWADQPTWGALAEARGVGVVMREANPTRRQIEAALCRVVNGDLSPSAAASSSKSSFDGAALHAGSRPRDRANVLGVVVRAEPAAETAVEVLESCLCDLVLTPGEADEVHPLAPPPRLGSLTDAQRMCLRHCIPCSQLRSALAASSAGGAASPDPAIVAAAWGRSQSQSHRMQAADGREGGMPAEEHAAVSDDADVPDSVSAAPATSSGIAGLRHRTGRGRTRASSPPPAAATSSGSDDDTDTDVSSSPGDAAAGGASAGARGDEDAEADAELLAASEAKRARSHAAVAKMEALLRQE